MNFTNFTYQNLFIMYILSLSINMEKLLKVLPKVAFFSKFSLHFFLIHRFAFVTKRTKNFIIPQVSFLTGQFLIFLLQRLLKTYIKERSQKLYRNFINQVSFFNWTIFNVSALNMSAFSWIQTKP